MTQTQVKFVVGEIVQVREVEGQQDLMPYKFSSAIVTAVYEHSLDLLIWQQELHNVPFWCVARRQTAPLAATLTARELQFIMQRNNSLEEFLQRQILSLMKSDGSTS